MLCLLSQRLSCRTRLDACQLTLQAPAWHSLQPAGQLPVHLQLVPAALCAWLPCAAGPECWQAAAEQPPLGGDEQAGLVCHVGGSQAQRDVLGYYALLGLDAGQADAVDDSSIKTAFRQAAMREHPDHQEVCLWWLCAGLQTAEGLGWLASCVAATTKARLCRVQES